MITINPQAESGKWFAHPDEPSIEFRIRPTSIYSLRKAPGESVEIEYPDIIDMFVYCLLDWKGIGGVDGKALPCNTKNKIAFINQHDKLATFVITKAGELKEEMVPEPERKNLPKSQPGETQSSDKPVAKTA